jgi:peptide-methionine (S)-S-oxide reductase
MEKGDMTSRKLNRGGLVVAMFAAAFGLLFVQRYASASRAVMVPAPALDIPSTAKTETAVFAGGCFWGIQAVFKHIKGVESSTSGYSGGWTDRPSYEQVSSGTTGHAESVRVVYDPSKVSYATLLKVFFSVAHDPTTLNRQGPDVGTQYRSAIFYMNAEQKQQADAYIKQLNEAHVFPKPIVTQVVQYKAFFPAEAYHQDYAENHPDEPYIVINDAPKVANLKKQFPEFYR